MRGRFFLFGCICVLSLVFCGCATFVLTEGDNGNYELALNDQTESVFVRINAHDLWFGETEMSVRQCSRLDSRFRWRSAYIEAQYGYTDDWPVINVSDTEAIKLCNRLNRRLKKQMPSGYMMRPPTVEEWEFIAQSGTEWVFPWGNAWLPEEMTDGILPNLRGEDKVEYNLKGLYGDPTFIFSGPHNEPGLFIKGYHDGHPGPTSVFKSGKNKLGIYGLAGNVEEWCIDPRSEIVVLKGASFSSYQDSDSRITNHRSMRRQRHPMNPWAWDRRSSYETGVRLVIGHKLEKELKEFIK